MTRLSFIARGLAKLLPNNSESDLPKPPEGNLDGYCRSTLPPSLPSHTGSQAWTRGIGFWRSFIAICIPLLLSALEGSVTNTALPTISDALSLGTKFSWVATAFLLASTILQPIYSQFGDIFGRKWPMIISIAAFGIGSAICGASQSGAVLIFGRIIQGLGSGAIDLFAEMILCDLVPLRRRGPYSAMKHVVFALGTTLGPVLGGIFAEHGWRWCFYVNIPVCAIAIGIVWLWLQVDGGIQPGHATLKEEMKKVDYVGAFLLTFAVVSVLVALSTGGAPHPWSAPVVIVPLILGFLGLVAFPFFESSAWCQYPIMPSNVFSNRTTNIAFILTVIHGFITYGFQFYLPPFFQAVKSSSPSKSGLEVMPTTLVIVVLAAVGGPVLTYWGKYKPIHIIGFAAMTLGLGLCSMFSKGTPVTQWLMTQLIVASGSGIVVSTMLPAVQVSLPESTTGASSGSWAFLRGTGSLFGVAIPGAIFNIRFTQLLPSISSSTAVSRLSNGQAYERASASFIAKFEPKIQNEIIHAFTESLKCVWIVFALLASVGFLMTWFEEQHKMRNELNTAYGLKSVKTSAATTATTTPVKTPATSGTATPMETEMEARTRVPQEV